jgi:hypothetical protein
VLEDVGLIDAGGLLLVLNVAAVDSSGRIVAGMGGFAGLQMLEDMSFIDAGELLFSLVLGFVECHPRNSAEGRGETLQDCRC